VKRRLRRACARATWVGLALLAFVPLRWLSALAQPVGLGVVLLGVSALLFGAVAWLRRDEETPTLLSRPRPWRSLPWLAAALAASLAGALGYADASDRIAREDEQARAQADEAERVAAVRPCGRSGVDFADPATM
jgi:hypothetical protein